MQLKGQAIGFKGEYAVTILDKHGNKKEYINKEQTIRSGEPIKNALLDTFFELLSTDNNNLSSAYIRCGSGAGAVEYTQTTLEQQLSLNDGSWPSSSVGIYNTVVENNVVKMASQYQFTFDISQIDGNISELGIMFKNSGSLHSRALVEDSQGQPATITITRDEQLVVTYKLSAEANADDVVQTVPMMINGVATNTVVTCRWAVLSSINISNIRITPSMRIGYGDLGPAFERALFQNSENMGSATGQTIITGGRRYNSTIAASRANYTRMIEMAASYTIESRTVAKYYFSPPIPKNQDRTLTLSLDYIFGRI